MGSRASLNSQESLFDFINFVAASRGISPVEAELLLEEWLEKYEPRQARNEHRGQPSSVQA
jgi:hypothetical protein